MYKSGCLRDKEDKRDYIYAPSGSVKYPENWVLHKVKIKNQGNVNSCVAHSIATIKEIQEFYETGRVMEFSTGWVYGYRVQGQYKGECMYPREALNNLCKYGDVLVADFPENMEFKDLQKLIEKRKAKCLQNGKMYRCKCYAKVTSINDVKHCLYGSKSPVLIVVNADDNLYNVGSNGVVGTKKCVSDGTHAMVIVGWKKIGIKTCWIVQNSWGAEWGDKGYCYISVDSNIVELYTVTDEKNVRR